MTPRWCSNRIARARRLGRRLRSDGRPGRRRRWRARPPTARASAPVPARRRSVTNGERCRRRRGKCGRPRSRAPPTRRHPRPSDDPPSGPSARVSLPRACVAAASRNASCTICSTGMPNAPVFPLPVSAAASTSPPPRINGTASACTGVGRSHPASSADRISSGHTPISSNADMRAGVCIVRSHSCVPRVTSAASLRARAGSSRRARRRESRCDDVSEMFFSEDLTSRARRPRGWG